MWSYIPEEIEYMETDSERILKFSWRLGIDRVDHITISLKKTFKKNSPHPNSPQSKPEKKKTTKKTVHQWEREPLFNRTMENILLWRRHSVIETLHTGRPTTTSDAFIPRDWPVVGHVADECRGQRSDVGTHLNEDGCNELFDAVNEWNRME